MDISDTIAPDSDQLDAVDLAAGPRVFTVKGVRKGNAEQPVQIDLAEFPRPWRPGKSMRRVLVAVWGADASRYVGRRVKLYCDPDVTFGKDKVGGTRIAEMSDLEKPRQVPLLVSRGKSAMFTVRPLVEESAGGALSRAEEPSDRITPEQLRQLVAAMDVAGIEPDARLTYARDITGRAIENAGELTGAEYDALIDALTGDES